MSRLRDFDEFLQQLDKKQQQKSSDRQKALLETRQAYDDFIRDAFSLLKEYHERIILPRTYSILILKKREAHRNDANPHLLYRANLVPTDFLPPAFRQTDIIERVDYLNPKEVTPNDWHANVALQLTIALQITDDSPAVMLKTHSWGHIVPENEQSVSLPFTVSHFEDKHTPYTKLTLPVSVYDNEQALNAVENILLLVTPHILNHRKTVWKK